MPTSAEITWKKVVRTHGHTYNAFDRRGRMVAFVHSTDSGETWTLVLEEGDKREVVGTFDTSENAKKYFDDFEQPVPKA